LASELLVVALVCISIDLLGRLINHHLYYVMRAPFEYAAMTWFFAAVCAAALLVPWRFPVLERIGLVSYGAYMLHDALLSAVAATGLRPTAVFILGYPLVIGAAELSYRFFESRFYSSTHIHQIA
jgi:peptidoglycan/LPS O-acetylase OafA/YrhL